MRIPAVVFLVAIFALSFAGRSHAQSSHSHDHGAVEEPHADHRHEAHKDRMNDPEVIEANRRYDAAWAEWRSHFYGINVERDMVVADIGAGQGDFALLLAREVGPHGQVYANEIDGGMLQAITKKIEAGGIRNVVPVLGIENDPLLPPNQIDLAVMVEVYHHLSNKSEFLRSIRSRVKTGSRLVIIEADVNQPGGAPDGCYTDPEAIRKEAESAGFSNFELQKKEIEGCGFFVLTALAD